MTVTLNARLMTTLLVAITLPLRADQKEPLEPQRPAGEDRDPGPQKQLSSSTPRRKPFLRSFLHDEFRMWSSPFRPGNFDSHTMRKYVIPFAIISGGLIASDRKTGDLLPNTADQTRWSGRVSQMGAAYTLAGASGAMYLFGKATADKHATETAWLGMQALAHTQLLTFGLKQITQRARPPDAEHRGGFWKGGDSFPSGHASSSFAFATVFAYEYRHHIAVPITAYTLASAVSLSRLSARRHWVSDIFVGGSLGFLVGRYVYKQHHDPSLPGSPVDRKARFVPDVSFGGNGFTLAWHY